MLARNHELSAFAATALAAAVSGVPPLGALALGLLGGWAGDWPDIDHDSATVTRSLRWVPYWRDHPRDKKTGDYKRDKRGRIVSKWRYFPSRQVHQFFCWISAWIWDRCATAADRRDTNGSWGPAFRVHRGFTHSVWCAGFTGALWWALAEFGGAAVHVPWDALAPVFGAVHLPVLLGCTTAAGMIAHIGGDACTDFGVAPFAPLLKVQGRRYPHMGLWEPMRFKVNKSVETWVVAPLMSLLAVYAIAGALLGPEHVLVAAGDFISGIWVHLA
jgi:hypothetical protein